MATSYNAHALSVGKKGFMVVTTFNGKSVTRHVSKAGIGNHPDDSIPAAHVKLSERVKKLTFELTELKDMVSKAEKLLLDPTYNPKAKSLLAFNLPTWRISMISLPDEIVLAERNLQALRASDPLLVHYNF